MTIAEFTDGILDIHVLLFIARVQNKNVNRRTISIRYYTYAAIMSFIMAIIIYYIYTNMNMLIYNSYVRIVGCVCIYVFIDDI